MADGDNNITTDDLPVDLEDDMGLEAMDPELQLELNKLQMEHIKLQQAQLQCKKRMLIKQAERRALMQNTPSSRCVLAGGRVVVRNVADGTVDADSNYTAGAGDSLKIPGLQRVGSRACIYCGAEADAFCSRCGVTPYCSMRCQRRDWAPRHSAVCHNLARFGTSDVPEAEYEPAIPPPAPLRRPRSPTSHKGNQDEPAGNQRDRGDYGNQRAGGTQRNQASREQAQCETDLREDDAKRANKTFVPAGQNPVAVFSDKSGRNIGRGGSRNFNNRNDNRGEKRRPPHRHELKNQKDENEDWGVRASNTEPAVAKPEPPVAKPEPIVAKPEPIVAKPQPVVPKRQPETVTPKPAPKLDEEKLKVIAGGFAKPPGNLTDVTPSRKLVPKNCVIETLSIGDDVILTVDSKASECRSTTGFLCVSMHESVAADYDALCDAYGAACEADTVAYTPTPGEAFSYFNPSDEAWYRARCLSPTLAALLDGSKVVQLSSSDKCRRMDAKFEGIPEFCCLLQADVAVGDSLQCTLLGKTANGFKVSLKNIETAAMAGEGELARWLPEVEYPKPAPVVPGSLSTSQPLIPEVSRPSVVNNSTVLLVEASGFDMTFLRLADMDSQRKFDAILQDVVLYGRSATPLKIPPLKGQTVIGKFTDDLHYRALVKRTNVKQNKYLLEYIEFGNTHISGLEDLYPCPQNLDLTAQPTVTTQVALQMRPESGLTPAATAYLDKLKDNCIELTLTLPSGVKMAPSGSSVVLTVAKNNEVVNRKLDEMCTPEWKKIEDRGGDVVESECIMFNELEYLELPPDGCELEILDFNMLHAGVVSGYLKGLPHAQYVLTHLTDKMEKYCNSEIGREPYLPKDEELCIAQCPPYPQWFRAALVERVTGAGGALARVCYVDYGNLEEVPVTLLRKMLPEFVRGLPALASTIEIRNFPKDPTPTHLAVAAQFMKVNDMGRGELRVTRCEKDDVGAYVVDAPDLIAALTAA